MGAKYGTAPSELVGIAARSVAGMLLNAEAFAAGIVTEDEARKRQQQEMQNATLGVGSRVSRFRGR